MLAWSRWFKIFVVLLCVVALVIIMTYSYRAYIARDVSLQRFIVRHNLVSLMLREFTVAPDSDLASLSSYGVSQDWQGALNVVERAIVENEKHSSTLARLVVESEIFSGAAMSIQNSVLRTSALAASADLRAGNIALRSYLGIGARVLAELRERYLEFLGRDPRRSVVPLAQDAENMSALFAAAQSSYRSFEDKMQKFDEMFGSIAR